MVSSIQSEESSLCACNGKSKTKLLHANIVDSNWTATRANVIHYIGFSCSGSHVTVAK